MNDVYLGEDHYKNIAITEINEAINFCMTNNLSKDKKFLISAPLQL